jgi:hypothetical protein
MLAGRVEDWRGIPKVEPSRCPRFLATQRDHKLRQHNLSVVSARDELRQTIAILGWQEHRWQKERLCNFGHLHHGGLQSGRVTCAMAIFQQLSEEEQEQPSFRVVDHRPSDRVDSRSLARHASRHAPDVPKLGKAGIEA